MQYSIKSLALLMQSLTSKNVIKRDLRVKVNLEEI